MREPKKHPTESPALNKHFAAIVRKARALRKELVSCHRDADALTEHLDFIVAGGLTKGTCERGIEECDFLIGRFS